MKYWPIVELRLKENQNTEVRIKYKSYWYFMLIYAFLLLGVLIFYIPDILHSEDNWIWDKVKVIGFLFLLLAGVGFYFRWMQINVIKFLKQITLANKIHL